MPAIVAVATIDFPHKVEQQKVKEYAKELFRHDFPQTERLIQVFDNTDIIYRNFSKPLHTCAHLHGFGKNNKEYISISLEYSVQAVEAVLAKCSTAKSEITDIIFISTSGLATPSMDAMIVNQMQLNQDINRMAIFGLGCAGGVSGMARANTLAVANPDAVVLLVAVELCSLTFLRHDYTKSNFVASGLFSDGVAACIIKGDNHKTDNHVHILGSGSKLYYDSLDVMGWEFLETGFKVLFSQDIPAIIKKNVANDVQHFLAKHNLQLGDIKNFIFHPGGKKVLAAYVEALTVEGDFLKITREVMQGYGNMSSATVLYVLERYMTGDFEDGYGLMVAMGPGFSSEMVLLDMKH